MYHTHLDNQESIDSGTLQHFGENLVAFLSGVLEYGPVLSAVKPVCFIICFFSARRLYASMYLSEKWSYIFVLRVHWEWGGETIEHGGVLKHKNSLQERCSHRRFLF